MLFEAATTVLALSRGTDFAASRLGVLPFLPALAAKRFSFLGGIDVDIMRGHMKGCTAFSEPKWCSYWTNVALMEASRLDEALKKSGVASSYQWIENGGMDAVPEGLSSIFSSGAAVITQTSIGTAINLDVLSKGTSPAVQNNMVAVDAFLKVIAYLFLAAWPGRTPKRNEIYCTCTRLFHILLDAVAPTVGLEVERQILKAGGGSTEIIRLFPRAIERKAAQMPAILVSNGLEGTNFESILFFIFGSGNGGVLAGSRQYLWAFMEMPGTYIYEKPMKVGVSEQIYCDIISNIADHPLVDSNAIGLKGLSFGAHWATRMAFSDNRIKAVIANGAPISRSFKPWGAFGIPQIMIDALSNASGASNPFQLGKKLGALALTNTELQSISIPILAINGAEDTLVSTQDTVDIAKWAPKSRLHLYPGDDHCAMGHIEDWLKLSVAFFDEHLPRS